VSKTESVSPAGSKFYTVKLNEEQIHVLYRLLLSESAGSEDGDYVVFGQIESLVKKSMERKKV
jgi:hypothetical protein